MTSCSEQWRDVPGFEGAYQVSNLGRIRSRRKVLKVEPNWDGYLRVRLQKSGKKTWVTVHRAVALAFVPNPENKPQVNHKDGDRSNCKAENLEWLTNGENQKHRRTVMGSGGNKAKRACVCTSTGQSFGSLSEAARQTGVRVASIAECCQGKRKTAAGKGWAYKERTT